MDFVGKSQFGSLPKSQSPVSRLRNDQVQSKKKKKRWFLISMFSNFWFLLVFKVRLSSTPRTSVFQQDPKYQEDVEVYQENLLSDHQSSYRRSAGEGRKPQQSWQTFEVLLSVVTAQFHWVLRTITDLTAPHGLLPLHLWWCSDLQTNSFNSLSILPVVSVIQNSS